MNKTVLYQLTEAEGVMMSFVIITKQNNVIVIDGGRESDMFLLKQYIGKRHISAWILTHPHEDHISGLISEYKRNNAEDFDIEMIYYNFPPYEIIKNTNVLDYDYYRSELEEVLPDFMEVLPLFHEKTHLVQQGESLQIDEVRIDFIYCYHEGLTNNVLNDSSLVFKVNGPDKTVLFLGDLGPDGGDMLYRESRHLLKSDIVQMAHHGHMNCSMEVYAAIDPEVCLWCCPEWLYNEPEVPEYLTDEEKLIRTGRIRMYGTAVTRRWMEQLGVKHHYISKDGINKLVL